MRKRAATASALILPLLVLLLTSASLVVVAPRAVAQTTPTNDEWTTSLHDVERTGSSSDTNISTSAAPTLTKLWSYQAGGIVASQVSVSGGTAYFGSWDGYENAVNATTGALEWKTYLGVTTAPPADNCFPSTAGVDSAATIVNGVDYVGGGDNYWYALNASTGAVLWRVLVGSPTGVYDGHYNWSSPLIVNGYAYVGVASFGDCPLIQGQLIQVNLATGTIQNTANLVPNGQIGGGIWTSPAYDPATNTIYTATGTETTPSQQWAQAVLAINATTMEVTDSWKLPETEAIFDSDFGTSTTLFSDPNGDQLLGVINKNGYMYAFNRNSLSSGPIWQRQIAIGGDCPTCGDSSVSSAAAFGSGTLFVAGGQGFINGVGYPGTIDALNPATGAIEWQHPAPGTVIGALTYDNGMLIDAAGSVLEILDATTGQRLYSYDTGSAMWAAPSIADGIIYTGNNAGTVTAFELPSTPPPAPPADPNCPSTFTCQDIGSPTPAGSEVVANGAWAIAAGGTGVGGTSDSFRLASQTATGDTQVTAQVTQVPTTAGSQAGLMIRQRNDPGSPYYAVLAEPNNTLAVEYRSQFGGQAQVAATTTDPGVPLYLMIQRVGDNFQAATSSDGVNYTLVPGSDASLPLPTAVMAGLAVSSGANGTPGTALLSAVSIGSPGTAPAPPAPATPCPSGWSCQDVGNPGLPGNQSLSGGTWTLTGAGNGIDQEQPTDQFHYVWQTEPGDATVSAQVLTQTVTDPNAAAGVMMRTSTAGNAEYYGAFLTPDNGIEVQYRTTTGLASIQATTQTAQTPAYIRVARSGTTFTTYTSTDGTTWTPVDVSTVTLPNLSGSILAGLAVSSNAPNNSGTVTFGSVTVAASAPAAPGACPASWDCEDIGLPALPGIQNDNNGSWTIQASGGDIWDTVDQFHFVAQSFSGNGSVSAQVQSQSLTDPWAKSGVMVRLSDIATDPYYGVFATPQNGIVVQYRSQANAFTSQVAVTGAAPTYLKVGVSGYNFSAYTSSDGVNWQLVPNSTVTIPSLTGDLLAGLVVCSHNSQELNTTVFNSVAINSSGIVGLPSPWSDADVGAATPSGSASFSDNVYTVNGGGNDLGSSSDQFNYVSQPMSGDGTVIAQVTSQSDTDPWAKSGVMMKQSTTSGAPYAFIGITPANGVTFQYGDDVSVSGGSYTSPNIWVKLTRQGTVITGYSSTDGVNWTQVGQAVVAMTDPVTVGLAVTSDNPNALNTSTFTDVSVSPVGDGPLPGPWTSQDVGSPGLPGSGAYTPYDGTFTINGSGAAIGGTSDQFQYVNQPMNGDGTITARVVTQDQTDPWAESGIMIRQSAASGAPYALLAATPGNGIVFQGTGATTVSAGNYGYPEWLSLQRVGNEFVALESPDGVNWTQVGSMSVPMDTQVTVGLVVSSHNNAVLNTSTFDSVSVDAGSLGVPAPWSDQDIGSPGVAGSASYDDGTFTVSGSGNDIWQTLDQFNYASEPFSGNETITARVTSQSDTDPWAKSGIMIKQSDAPGSPYVLLAETPGNGVQFQYNFDTTVTGGTYTLPNAWLRLQLAGGVVTAYDSPDGVNWTEVGSTSLVLSGSATIGLAVCSHNNGVINTSTFDNVTLSPSPVILSPASATFALNTANTFALSATADAPVSYSETGALPNGVTLSPAGVLAGTPATGTVGSYPITITATDGGGNTVTQAFVLTVAGTTTVTSVSPASGPTTGGTGVTITGTNFTGATAVDFGSVPASTFTVGSAGSITATAPAQAAGTVDVTVTTPGGTSATGTADKFTYDAAPTVTKVAPAAGPTAGGTVVTITGTHFVVGATTVAFGSTAGKSVTCSSTTSCTATSPAGAAATVDVTVTTAGGTSATGTADKFTYDAAPTVTKVSPAAGPTAGGTVVTITGTHFVVGATTVAFGSTAGKSVTCSSTTSCTATSPAGAAATVDVTVTTAGGTSATATADKFTYDAAPTVTKVSPAAGPTAGGTVVTITGTHFVVGATTVAFGSTAGKSVTCSSTTSCTATSPAGAAATVDVTVTTAGGTSATGTADKFTYDAAPTVTKVSPAAGPTAGGTVVTITGTHFVVGATTVAFGSTAGKSVTCSSTTSCTATSPAGAAATVDVTVTTPGGTSAKGTADKFTYDAAPKVTKVSPTSGSSAGGTKVTITGTNFTGASTVAFGSSAGKSVSCSSSASCSVTSPAGTVGAVDITVTTAGGTSAKGTADKFTYVAPKTAKAALGSRARNGAG